MGTDVLCSIVERTRGPEDMVHIVRGPAPTVRVVCKPSRMRLDVGFPCLDLCGYFMGCWVVHRRSWPTFLLIMYPSS